MKEHLLEPQQDVIKLVCSAKGKGLITRSLKLPYSTALRTLSVLARLDSGNSVGPLAKTWESRSVHGKPLSCKTAASACATNQRLQHLLPGCAANLQTWLHKPSLKSVVLLMKMSVTYFWLLYNSHSSPAR